MSEISDYTKQKKLIKLEFELKEGELDGARLGDQVQSLLDEIHELSKETGLSVALSVMAAEVTYQAARNGALEAYKRALQGVRKRLRAAARDEVVAPQEVDEQQAQEDSWEEGHNSIPPRVPYETQDVSWGDGQ